MNSQTHVSCFCCCGKGYVTDSVALYTSPFHPGASRALTKLCSSPHHPSPELLRHLRQKLCTSMNNNPAALRLLQPLFCFLSLWIQVEATCKWNHTLLELLWLAYSTYQNVFRLHPRCSMCQSLIIFKTIIFHRFLDPFICWRALGCHHLAVVNQAVGNVSAQVSAWVPAGSSFSPVDHMVILCLVCWRTPNWFPQWLYQLHSRQ